jgi:serine protease Do
VDKPATSKTNTAYIGVVFPDDEDDDAWLKEVEADAPADKGGLQVGDTITKFNDTPIKTVRAFRKQMETAKPGDRVKLTVRRGTAIMALTVTLSKRA